MRHRSPSLPFSRAAVGGLALLATLAWASDARAGVEACGDVHVAARAECELLVEGGCVAECTPVSMEAACAAELQAECSGQCDELPSLECSGSCEADCSAQCAVDPGSFDCRVACNTDCQGACSAECSTGDSECVASCEGACSAECSSSCEVEPPEASCDARCEAACEGSCEAKANLSCQVDCQADGFVECKADLQGGCEARCQQPEGALFCDGQYVDHGGNLDECVAALRALYDIEVDGYAEGRCQPGRCEGEAGGSISCAVSQGGDGRGGPNGPVLLGVLAVLLGVAGRRGR